MSGSGFFGRAAHSVCPAIALALSLCVIPAAELAGQAVASGKVERAKVHGVSLEGNLSGDSPDRDVSVYLPPSYSGSPGKRYPVIYMLHGYTDSDDKWMGPTKHWIHLPTVLSRANAEGRSGEFIVVMLNAFTRFEGSMYSSGVTTGDWESFVAKELVAWWTGAIARLQSRRVAELPPFDGWLGDAHWDEAPRRFLQRIPAEPVLPDARAARRAALVRAKCGRTHPG